MSRVRLIVQHPDYGTLTNLRAILAIEQVYNHKVLGRIGDLDLVNIPPELKGLARWKRAVQLAARLPKIYPHFLVRTFREPRRVRPGVSLFWNTLAGYGVYPKRKTKPKAKPDAKPVDPANPEPGEYWGQIKQILQQAQQPDAQQLRQRRNLYLQMNPLGAPWLEGWKPR